MMDFAYGSDEKYFRMVRSRLFIFTGFVITVFLVLLIRLWYLQVIQGDNLNELAENNRLRQISLPDYRGTIYDRTGVELVSSRASFNLVVIREDMPDFNAVMDKLATLISFDKEEAIKKIKAQQPFQSYVLAHDISRDDAAILEEHRYELPGVSLDVRPVRSYTYERFSAHLLGYLGEISKAQIGQGFYKDYRKGDFIGRYGIERSFEPLLRGKKGVNIIEVDAAGRELKMIKRIPPSVGTDIYLSIDFKAQLAAEHAMEGKNGAAVAINPKTGEILAMVSHPDFDPNEFASGVETEYWRSLLNDPYFPLNNRAIQGIYPPGSTFKFVMAAAGLKEGVIDENTAFHCNGTYRLGRRVYRCWKKGGHGNMTLTHALEQSCDVYFYNVGMRLGVDKIYDMAAKFGLSQRTGLGLDNEKAGLIPNTAWKEKNRKEAWIAGETLSVAIGQGYDQVTPIQMARAIAAVANGGWMPNLRLTRLGEHEATTPEALGGQQLGLSEKNVGFIKEGLDMVVNSDRGTAFWNCRIPHIRVAGKTGTAQVVKLKEGEQNIDQSKLPEKYRDHAWFVAFAPVEDPRIAVAVIVEHGGHGGTAAAPVARAMIAAYLDAMIKEAEARKVETPKAEIPRRPVS